ncbi:hypothetical protein GCM10010433_43670 [Streptomyces pulveraceus]
MPATVPPSGRAALPPCPLDGDGDGSGFPSSSPMLMQPVDAATVAAMTAAHRRGTDNWRTRGTSGIRGRERGGTGRRGGAVPNSRCPAGDTPRPGPRTPRTPATPRPRAAANPPADAPGTGPARAHP